MIVSPYNRSNPLPYSQITCLVISEEVSPDGTYRKFSAIISSCYLYPQMKELRTVKLFNEIHCESAKDLMGAT